MSDFNQPAYPTTPEHYGYSPDFETRMYSGSGLTKLQRIASEQLAALIIASQSRAEFPPLEDCDMQQDDNGRWMKFQNEWVRASESYDPRKCYKVVTTLKARLARHAVEYAKALLEIAE